MFKNVAPIDFSIAKNREEFAAALDTVDAKIKANKYYACPIVDGEELSPQEELPSIDPSSVNITIGSVKLAKKEEVDLALASIKVGADSWHMTPCEIRTTAVRKIGQLMQEQRLALAALIVREAGKPWMEADGDVIEAIDFCNYYAAEMERLAQPIKTSDILGEENYYHYQPRGNCLVISPWNFPLAILCGMACAALVTGNSVVIKPSGQTSIIAFEFAKLLAAAGIPKDAFAFLPGRGSEIGNLLVEHPCIDLICFTGSLEVGLNIIKKASVVTPEQRNIKKVITELGGKNAIIVDEDADLDEATKGVLASAFGYAGQKCSACSRAIIVGDAYEPFVKRLAEAASDIIIGEAKEAPTIIGPLIDKSSQTRIMEIIAKAEQTDALAFKGKAPASGYFVPPTIFKDVSQQSQIWTEELFAPVLACAKAENFNHALELANDSKYALTGGLFSRSPKNIEEARKHFNVGNLYINRKCTGAIVGRQPFGGSKMSGIGSKAGGPDYLLQFLRPRTVTENTMRKGFAPELV